MTGVSIFVACLLLATIAVADRTANDRCRITPDGVFISNPLSCDGWYQCKNGIAVPGTCESGLHFDAQSGHCMHVENKNCQNPCENEPEGAFVNNPESCSAFFQCFGKVGRPGHCPDGLVFEPQDKKCEYKENHPCEDHDDSKTPEGYVCTGVPDGVFVRDERSCDGWFRCNNFTGFSGKCDKGLYFEASTGKCNYQEEVSCNLGPEPKDPCDGVPEGGFIADQNSCSGFFQCLDGKAKPGTCPDDLLFDGSKCVYPDQMQCHLDPCHNQPDHKFINDPSACDAYFQCIDGKSEKGTCPAPYVFNPQNGICDWRENVHC